jgi:hypothetical protein
MTHVEKKMWVRREVRTVRGAALIVTLAAEGIYLREKGRRTAFLLPYGVAYQRAASMADDAERRAKAIERKARRAERAK